MAETCRYVAYCDYTYSYCVVHRLRRHETWYRTSEDNTERNSRSTGQDDKRRSVTKSFEFLIPVLEHIDDTCRGQNAKLRFATRNLPLHTYTFVFTFF